jgi:hypothetical protein
MAISKYTQDNEKKKFKESTSVADQPGVVVVNPDGSNIGGGGSSTVTGNVASGATDSGNPVKVGGKYNSTFPTFTDGQRGDLQIGSRGSTRIEITDPNGISGAVVGSPADSSSNASTGLFTQARNMTYNGTSWDMARSGNGAVGVGVQRITLANDSTGNIATIGTSIVPGTAATHLGKAEDAAHTSGDTGVMALTVRADTAAATAGTTGDYQPQITDSVGATWMREYYAPGYEDNTNNVAKVEQRFTYQHLAAGQATTTVKSGAGFLHSITLNGAATATNVTTVYDNTAGSGTVIAIPAATTATVPTTLTYDVSFTTGLTIVTATANGSDMTISYR